MTDSRCILFDMDGVLVDTTGSYREAIAQTVRAQVPEADLFWSGSVALRAIKGASGFNNDWHAAEALCCCARAGARPEQSALEGLLARCMDEGGGLTGIQRVLGVDAIPLPDGEPLHPTIARFQSLYLGSALYAALHPESTLPTGTPARGLIEEERLIAGRPLLQALSERLPLGIATGRPRGEAEHALRVHGIDDIFLALVTHDDVLEARRLGVGNAAGKPSPWPLKEAARRLGRTQILQYLGDLPDDMRAAMGAGAEAIGIPGEAGGEAELIAAGAARVFETTDEALQWCIGALDRRVDAGEGA